MIDHYTYHIAAWDHTCCQHERTCNDNTRAPFRGSVCREKKRNEKGGKKNTTEKKATIRDSF